MKFGLVFKTIAGVVLAAMLAIGLRYTFRAYQNPTHVAQWVSLLQLCR